MNRAAPAGGIGGPVWRPYQIPHLTRLSEKSIPEKIGIENKGLFSWEFL
jgi:hypothetical protein